VLPIAIQYRHMAKLSHILYLAIVTALIYIVGSSSSGWQCTVFYNLADNVSLVI